MGLIKTIRLFYTYAWYSSGYVCECDGEPLERHHASEAEAKATGMNYSKRVNHSQLEFRKWNDGTIRLNVNLENESPSKSDVEKMIRFLQEVKRAI